MGCCHSKSVEVDDNNRSKTPTQPVIDRENRPEGNIPDDHKENEQKIDKPKISVNISNNNNDLTNKEIINTPTDSFFSHNNNSMTDKTNMSSIIVDVVGDNRKKNIRRLSHLNINDEGEKNFIKSDNVIGLIKKSTSKSTVLSQFEDKQIDGLISKMYLKVLEESETILTPDDICSFAFVIENGEIEINVLFLNI